MFPVHAVVTHRVGGKIHSDSRPGQGRVFIWRFHDEYPE